VCASSSAICSWWSGDVGCGPSTSIAAVTARWIDRLQVLEIEFGDRVQLVRQSGFFEVSRQVVEPGAIFGLQRDECRYRCCPALWSWHAAPRRHRGRRWAVLLAAPGAVPRLTFGWG